MLKDLWVARDRSWLTASRCARTEPTAQSRQPGPGDALSSPRARRHAHCGRSAVTRARIRLASPLPSAKSREKQLRSRPATCRGGSGRRSWWGGCLTPSTGGIRLSRRRKRSVALVALLLDPQWTSLGPAGWSGQARAAGFAVEAEGEAGCCGRGPGGRRRLGERGWRSRAPGLKR